MTNPDMSHPAHLNEQSGAEMTRRIGDRIMRVIIIPSEDPMTVMERDKVEKDDYIGSKRITELSTYGNAPGQRRARQAPKYIGESPGFFR